jgi:hypothetical protein
MITISKCINQPIYIIKEFVQPKISINREFLIWKDRGRVYEIERGGRG